MNGRPAPSEATSEFRTFFEALPGLYLVLNADLTVVAASDLYLQATRTTRADIAGRPFFEVFPRNPHDANADAVDAFRASFGRVLESRRSDAMAVQKRALRRADGSGFEERYWSPLNSPVLGSDGAVTHIIHRVEDVTELRAARDQLESRLEERTGALARSETRFARLAESGVVGIVVADTRGNVITDANDEFLRIIGYSRDDLGAGRVLISQLTPPGWEEVDATAREQFRSRGFARPWEKEYLRKDGTRVPVLVAITLADPPYCIALVTDLTERKQAEAALRRAQEAGEAEAIFRGLLEAAPDAMVIVNDAGRILLSNARTAELFGYATRELVGEPVERLVPERHRGPHLAHRERYFASRAVRPMGAGLDLHARRKDGSEFPVEISLSPLETREGTLISASIRDVTERKQTERALARAHDELEQRVAERTVRLTRTLEDLRASEARFSRLAESGIIGIITADLTGKVIHANDAFLRMSGFSRGELVAGAIQWNDLTPRDWREATDRALEELRTTGVASAYEKEYERRDGSRIPILLGAAMLTDSTSIAFMIDLTRQKRAEEALKRTEVQLRQSQKMEAVGRLAGGVAHDFNNLLSVVLSYSSTLAAELTPGDPMRADIEEIEKAGQRAAELTRQLLTFSRQEVTEPRILDINGVLANMDKMLRRILGEDVELVSLHGSGLGRIRVDPGHIEQVIMNLVVNSRDAMPRGGKLTIETKEVEFDEAYAEEHLDVTPGRYVMLAVSDTGVGMDRATQSRIFEPFFTTKERGKGTGLGLSTVFGIVKQCGGAVGVYSEPGLGTTFKVYIPRVDATADTSSVTTTPSTLAGSETILLVEDEEQIRAVARGILRKRGYHVIEARSAGEALLHCENHPGQIHLLLTDVVMPQLSGPELARRLVSARPGTKVLYMSGYPDEALLRHGAVEAGVAYLQKPLTPESLSRKVRAVLDAG
ncbi:MAG TPA: PAS domain S-box protein [Polyangiaceae bacterium]|nr:PAS domain S-box protein [Polyangiaceae bacterium]